VSALPMIEDITDTQKDQIVALVKQNIALCKLDWDSKETSWDFCKHPFLVQAIPTNTLKTAAENWQKQVYLNMIQLKENEQKINQFFIEKYGLKDGLQSEVRKESLAIKEVNPTAVVKEFISYAVGCMFGRYSLDEEGLIFAGGEFQTDRYITFSPDRDNILPILPGAYFENDIVIRLIEFVRLTYGEKYLEENLDYIANLLEKKKEETAKETIRRFLLNDFFKDHVQRYKKRPIYWLFTSGRQKAFNCLVYMHRYDKTTLSRIRTDYLHEYQIRIEAERKSLLNTMEGDSTATEISLSKKALKALEKKIDELKEYDELLHHMADQQIEIDLDDGVEINYAKFKGLVVKI
ncbi:MAG: SAM-dependent methyltransferase, partial [Bacillota bacterium]|nr:SAM-dependent methyltransferase [Bacillota bacterium]